MSSVIPAVIPVSREHLLATLEGFSKFAAEAQVDITDSAFAGSASWPFTEHALGDALSGMMLPLPIELDLMIAKPELMLDMWMGLNPMRVVVHLESIEDIEAVFLHRKNHGYKLGLAMNNDTPLEQLLSFRREAFDYIELMGIATIGTQGQPFDERVLERVQKIKAAYPDLEVSVDGSVNIETLPRLRDAGADRFVVGSAIIKSENPADMYGKLSALAA